MDPFTCIIVDHKTQTAVACRNTSFSKGLNTIKIHAERVSLLPSPYLQLCWTAALHRVAGDKRKNAIYSSSGSWVSDRPTPLHVPGDECTFPSLLCTLNQGKYTNAEKARESERKYRQGRTEMEKSGGDERERERERGRLKWIERGKLKNRERELQGGLLREKRGGARGGERRGNEASDWLYTSSLWKLIGRELEGTNLSTLLGKCSATNYEG